MSTTITIRVDPELRDRLRARAEAEGKNLSELLREILTRAAGVGPLGDRIRALRGTVRFGRGRPDSWGARLRERNWRE